MRRHCVFVLNAWSKSSKVHCTALSGWHIYNDINNNKNNYVQPVCLFLYSKLRIFVARSNNSLSQLSMSKWTSQNLNDSSTDAEKKFGLGGLG